MKYLTVVEPTSTGFSAYSPDLPGCLATGGTREEVEKEMREAIEFHIDGMREEGYDVPPPEPTQLTSRSLPNNAAAGPWAWRISPRAPTGAPPGGG